MKKGSSSLALKRLGSSLVPKAASSAAVPGVSDGSEKPRRSKMVVPEIPEAGPGDGVLVHDEYVRDLGVSLAFLKDFAAENLELIIRDKLTTGEVHKKLIKATAWAVHYPAAGAEEQGPVAKEVTPSMHGPKSSVLKPLSHTQGSYAERGQAAGKLDSLGRPAFQMATVFVAQSWNNLFGDLVESLEAWAEESNADPKETYYFLDLFSVRPSRGGWKQCEEWWSERYMKTIGSIGNTVVVAEPWNSPLTFVGPWCIWQLYCTTVTGARLHLTMSPSQRMDFVLSLTRSFEVVRSSLCEIRVGFQKHDKGKTKTMLTAGLGSEPLSPLSSHTIGLHSSQTGQDHSPTSMGSKLHIIDEIERVVSFERLDEVLQTRLRHWLAQGAKKELKILQERTTAKALRRNKEGWQVLDPAELSLRDHVGQLLREMGNLSEAEDYFRTLRADIEKRLGTDADFTLAATNHLAVTLQRQRAPEKKSEAEQLHRYLLQKRNALCGEENILTLQTLSNLGEILLKQWREGAGTVLNEARGFLDGALKGRRTVLGWDHPRTLYTATTLAQLLSASMEMGKAGEKDVKEAQELHEEATFGLQKMLGPGHPLTLRAVQHLAEHRLFRGAQTSNLQLCLQAHEELSNILAKHTVALGREHETTAETRELVQKATAQVRAMNGNDTMDPIIAVEQEVRPWRDFLSELCPVMTTAEEFATVRAMLRRYGVDRLLEDMIDLGFVDEDNHMLTTGMKPFNVFARIGSGTMNQESMQADQALLGNHQDKFVIACNRPECDDNWESADPAWLGKASMAKHHRFITTKNLHWSWFNCLVFGMVGNLREAVDWLEELQEAAQSYVSQKEGWPQNVGFFFHVYNLSSVNSLHLHIVDMDHVGPTFHKMSHKNLALADVVSVLRSELDTIC